jgi:hypothetical protein
LGKGVKKMAIASKVTPEALLSVAPGEVAGFCRHRTGDITQWSLVEGTLVLCPNPERSGADCSEVLQALGAARLIAESGLFTNRWGGGVGLIRRI